MEISENTRPLLQELTRHAMSVRASELRIVSDFHPTCVVNGVLTVLKSSLSAQLSTATVRALHIECCKEAGRTELFYVAAAEYSVDSPSLGQYRCAFSTRGDTATLRLWNETAIEYEVAMPSEKPPHLSEEASPNSPFHPGASGAGQLDR
jgi:Tfp pilus assembly ATPase PilU